MPWDRRRGSELVGTPGASGAWGLEGLEDLEGFFDTHTRTKPGKVCSDTGLRYVLTAATDRCHLCAVRLSDMMST